MKPHVVTKFTGKEILGEKGRILFALLNAFSQTNFPIMLICENSKTLGFHGDKIFQFTNLSVIDRIPDDTSESIFLFDHCDKITLKKPWLKTIRVRFDIFASFWRTQPILFPYPVHPVHINRNFQAKLPGLRKNSKKVRLFFSGDMKGYDKSRIKYPSPKLPRLEIVNTLLEAIPENVSFLKTSQAAEELFSGSFSNHCVIIDTGQTWINDQFWLNYLAKADFFLAPPGIVMPMCHNIIEAMSVGAIPVTNYPEWFHPKLEHLKNCIAFSNKQDLIDKVNLVLDMNPKQISRMRENVTQYYDNYLTTDWFIQTFEKRDDKHIDILMITERYVAQNASKLNKHSFIIRGPSVQNGFSWHKLLDVFKQ